MGAVYEAEQEQPRRIVALKMIKPGFATPELLRRFEREAQAIGRLQHPGIAQIYEAGAADTGFGPQPYFAMELIRGKTLTDHAEAHRLNTRDRLELVAKISEAVHHAHQRGLIHRDLKPSNILVDETGHPRILDFGVARVTDSDAHATRQTDVGQLVGTLAYMSPEQVLADPLELDTRSDVYALGVILYELLAGRLPYTISNKLPENVHAIREEDPARLSVVDRNYRGDIETIVAKALEKDRARRYASAAELAADIQRSLKDEPIVARPPSTSYQLQKFARRHRAVVVGVAAVFVVLVSGIVASTWQAVRARRAESAAVLERDRTRVERDRAAAAERVAATERDRALSAERQAASQRDRADTEAATAKEQRLITIWKSLARESVLDSASRVDDDRAALLARQAMLFNTRIPDQPEYLVEEALQQAARLDPQNHNMLPGSINIFSSVAFSPDGVRLAAGGSDKTLRLWNLRNPTVPPLLLLLPGRGGGTVSVAFSPDGMHLAGCSQSPPDGAVRLWDVRSPGAPPVLLPAVRNCSALAFSPDGARLAGGGSDPKGGLFTWDLQNPDTAPVALEGASLRIYAIAFSPDGTRLASAGDDIQVWDIHNPNAQPHSLEPRAGAVSATRGRLQPSVHRSLSFSPDGMRLAAGGDDGVQTWDLVNPQAPPVAIQSSLGYQSPVTSVAYSPDGSHFSAAAGKTVLTWDLRNPSARPVLLQADSEIHSIAYSPNGARIAAATWSTVQAWELKNFGSHPALSQSPRGLDQLAGDRKVAYSADVTRLAASGTNVRVWDLRNAGASATALSDMGVPVVPVAFSRDGARLAGDNGSDLLLWDLHDPGSRPRLLGVLGGPKDRAGGRIPSVAISPDGTRLAAGESQTVWIWDLRNPNASPKPLKGPDHAANSLAFSPNGGTLAVGTGENTVQVWDLLNPSAPLLRLLIPGGDVARVLVFSPDGARLAAQGNSPSVRVWDLRNPGAPALVLQGQQVATFGLAFSPDGMRLAASAGVGLQMWDLRSPGAPAMLLQSQLGAGSGTIGAVTFSLDGLRLTAGGSNGRISVWRLWSEAADYLCTRVWRNLSMEEWRQYVGEGIPYERTCPALRPGPGTPRASK